MSIKVFATNLANIIRLLILLLILPSILVWEFGIFSNSSYKTLRFTDAPQINGVSFFRYNQIDFFIDVKSQSVTQKKVKPDYNELVWISAVPPLLSADQLFMQKLAKEQPLTKERVLDAILELGNRMGGGFGGINRLSNCVVFDLDNWSCTDQENGFYLNDDNVAVIGMIDGEWAGDVAAISRGASIYKWKTQWFIDTKINNKCGYVCYFGPKFSGLTTAILKGKPPTSEEKDAMIFGKNDN